MRTLILVLVTLLLGACGQVDRPCNSSNCTGCCDATGQCQQGASDFACGALGGRCSQCQFGSSCQLGVCLDLDPRVEGADGGAIADGGDGGAITDGGDGGTCPDCTAAVCTPNALGCRDNATATLCDGTGMQETVLPCGAGKFCAAGVCQPQVCTPGATTCSQDVLRVCDALGATSTNMPCASTTACTGAPYGCTCSQNACVARICTPGIGECVGNNMLRTCNADGLSYSALTSCPQACAAGQCVDSSCTPGSTLCSGSVLLTCNAQGNGYAQSDCAAAQQLCVSSGATSSCAARQCVPNSVSCDASGLAVARCDAMGRLATEPCAANTFCSGGACQPQVCAPGTRTCASAAAVSECNAQGSASMVTPCPASQTCSAGACSCTPQCAGRTCGLDPVCGTPCGTCAAGRTCLGTGTCAVSGAANLVVRLEWDTNGTDLDLDLRRTQDGRCSSQVCTSQTCRASSAPAPEWDNVTGRTDGDPVHELDDTNGFGPEVISIGTALPGTYVASVYYWGCGAAAPCPDTRATLKIFRNGQQIASTSRTLRASRTSSTGNDLWDDVTVELGATGYTTGPTGTVTSRASCLTASAGTSGAPCLANADCLPANNLLANLVGGTCDTPDAGWPGGYCRSSLCSSDQECPGNGYCVGDPMLGTACYANCNAQTCRVGYRCANLVRPDGGFSARAACVPL